MGDVRIEEGPPPLAFIDDATRAVPPAAFALSENTQTFLPVLQEAILRRGLPQRLSVDSGANYRSQHLALMCAKLGIALIAKRRQELTP